MVDASPLVSVICLCYNQVQWIAEAVNAVKNQTYPNIELIIVDDYSTDGSVAKIKEIASQYPGTLSIFHEKNKGNCYAFNSGWKKSHGQFVVDLAADDVMHPNRIEKQVALFQSLSEDYGVVFTDAIYTDEMGNALYYHTEELMKRKMVNQIPQGDIFKAILLRYFIASPTMMIKREVLEKLGGYDEELAYEDFDFWVRSSRSYQYAYLPDRLTSIRKHRQSMSTKWYEPGDKQVYSTYLICRKALSLCRTQDEKEALTWRIKYELRHATFSDNSTEALLFFSLLKELKKANLIDRICMGVSRLGLNLSLWRKLRYSLVYR